MESIDRFDPALGVRFRTFSGRRMHGTILDGLERMTEKQQPIAAKRRAQKERLQSLVMPRATTGAGARVAQTESLLRYLAIRCHYVQEIPFDAIADSRGLSKGRVSQIHREALLWLRHELKVERSSDLVC